MENSILCSATIASHNTNAHLVGCIHRLCLKGTLPVGEPLLPLTRVCSVIWLPFIFLHPVQHVHGLQMMCEFSCINMRRVQILTVVYIRLQDEVFGVFLGSSQSSSAGVLLQAQLQMYLLVNKALVFSFGLSFFYTQRIWQSVWTDEKAFMRAICSWRAFDVMFCQKVKLSHNLELTKWCRPTEQKIEAWRKKNRWHFQMISITLKDI